jgi:sugar O-acyltransferase (sialic acid O-acetyltransferase NeuD family)
MQKTPEKIVIVGDGEFAKIAYECFTHDSPHDVVAFCVETPFLKKDKLFGLPVVPFEDVDNRYDPAVHRCFVAITYTQLNRVRARLYHAAKAKGYSPISFVSSRAIVWNDVRMGENCFIFDYNVIQHQAEIGNNVVLRSGNQVGGRAVIRDHCYISSNVVVSDHCDVGESCSLGVNSSIGNNVKIGRDCVLGAGAVIVKDTEPGKVYRGDREPVARMSSLAFFTLKDAEKGVGKHMPERPEGCFAHKIPDPFSSEAAA